MAFNWANAIKRQENSLKIKIRQAKTKGNLQRSTELQNRLTKLEKSHA